MTEVQKVEDQTRITELSIMPDGRVYVFGTSRKVLEVLEAIGSKDHHVSHPGLLFGSSTG